MLALIFVAITVIGLIGNVLVLFVIAVNQQLHDRVSILICNLALADLLFLALCVPITAYSYVYSWRFSGTVCYVTVSLQYVTCYVSVWTLVLLAHDRFTSIISPTVSRPVIGRRRPGVRLCASNSVVYTCLALWLGTFAINYPQMRDVGVLTFQYNGTMGMACVDSLSIATATSTVAEARLFYWGFNLGAYVLPLALSTLFYFLLVRAIWKQKIVQSKSSEKMKRHATKMVFIVILTFGVCWFPQNMRFFLRGLNYPRMTFWERNADLLLLVQSTIQIIAYANSCVNPILYGALSERFRLGVVRAWRRFVCCDPDAAALPRRLSRSGGYVNGVVAVGGSAQPPPVAPLLSRNETMNGAAAAAALPAKGLRDSKHCAHAGLMVTANASASAGPSAQSLSDAFLAFNAAGDGRREGAPRRNDSAKPSLEARHLPPTLNVRHIGTVSSDLCKMNGDGGAAGHDGTQLSRSLLGTFQRWRLRSAGAISQLFRRRRADSKQVALLDGTSAVTITTLPCPHSTGSDSGGGGGGCSAIAQRTSVATVNGAVVIDLDNNGHSHYSNCPSNYYDNHNNAPAAISLPTSLNSSGISNCVNANCGYRSTTVNGICEEAINGSIETNGAEPMAAAEAQACSFYGSTTSSPITTVRQDETQPTTTYRRNSATVVGASGFAPGNTDEHKCTTVIEEEAEPDDENEDDVVLL